MRPIAPAPKAKWWPFALLIILAPLLLITVVFGLACSALYKACLRAAIWTWWSLRGHGILFVYSDSPVWHDYIAANILPRLAGRAVVLNWSRRAAWRFSLARLAFHHFGGQREFNPLAVVFRPLRRERTFRFWRPFRDYKHGRPEALHALERDFFESIGAKEQNDRR